MLRPALILPLASLLLLGCSEADQCSVGASRCGGGLLYTCVEDYGDGQRWSHQGSCPRGPARYEDPRCAGRKAYCEDDHTVVHCDGPYFNYRNDCTMDLSYPEAVLCVEPEEDVALCSPTEDPELVCEDVNRINGWACVGTQSISCSYGYARRYLDCKLGCAGEGEDAWCKGM